MSQSSPNDQESSGTAADAEYARNRVTEIEEEAAEAEAAIEADDSGMSLEEAVGQARPDA